MKRAVCCALSLHREYVELGWNPGQHGYHQVALSRWGLMLVEVGVLEHSDSPCSLHPVLPRSFLITEMRNSMLGQMVREGCSEDMDGESLDRCRAQLLLG